jgi:hypothetical protein
MPYQSFPWQGELVENWCVAGLVGTSCGDKSKTVNEIVNDSLTNVMMSNSSSCTSGSGINQKLRFSDFETADGHIIIKGSEQTGTLKMNFNCLQDQGLSAQDMKSIRDQIKNDVEQKSSGFRFQPAEQEVINKTVNQITSNASLSNTASCIANTLTDQEMVVERLKARGSGNINIENLSQTAIVDTTADCIQNQSALSENMKELQTLFDSKLKQENKGLDIFAIFTSFFSMISNLGTTYMIMCGVVSLGCILLCIVSSFMSVTTGNGDGNPPINVISENVARLASKMIENSRVE